MTRAALRYSVGQCEAFLGELVSDDVLLVLAQRAPSLKSLHLIRCFVSREGFAKAIKMLPLLEELEISLCPCLIDKKGVKLVAKACPMMKHLRLVRSTSFPWSDYIDEVAFAAARMKKLVSLHLVGLYVNYLELTTILDNCHDLEYLNMRDCDPLFVDDNLQLKFPSISMDDHEYLSDYDCTYLYNCRYYHADDSTCIGYSPSYLECDDDSYDVDYYNIYGDDGDDDDDDDDDDDVEFEEHEKILDIKNMRRYLS
ncbi:hypothetical protein ACQ4PT_020874 [Festuca glaucescens]